MIRPSLVVKAIFIAACFGNFHVTPTAAARGMKGLTSGIGTRSRKVLSKAHIPEDPAEVRTSFSPCTQKPIILYIATAVSCHEQEQAYFILRVKQSAQYVETLKNTRYWVPL